MEYEMINVNQKSGYISFTSPILKNKKGHKRQMTKSIKNIPPERLAKILQDIDHLLKNYEKYTTDYENFITVYEHFDPKAIAWAFEKSSILDKYNQSYAIRTIEQKVPVLDSQEKFILPTTAIIGESGSGKTTFLKQLIGSINSSFPATMQANTTMGSMYTVLENAAKKLICSVKIINKSAIKDRLKDAYIKLVKQVLSEGQNISLQELASIVHSNFTIFDDKKVKLDYILQKSDLIRNENLLADMQQEILKLWDEFTIVGKKLEINIPASFSYHLPTEVLEAFEQHIEVFISDTDSKEEENKKKSTLEQVFDLIEEKIEVVIRSMYSSLVGLDNIDFTINVMDEHKSINLDKNSKFSYPKTLTVTISYKDSEVMKPDNSLRQIFFKTLEFISSASEVNKSATLFPLVEHMRIKGNFKPLWHKEEDIADCILIDSEGIGHDITSESISMELRDLMAKATSITVVQNGGGKLEDTFTLTLKSLIYNGWIGKTLFCFNRMEEFDAEANASMEAKMNFISSNLKNVLKKIVIDEKTNDCNIVSGREYVFEKVILDNSYYLEKLKEVIVDTSHIISNENKVLWNSIAADNDFDENTKNKLRQKFITSLGETFNTPTRINEYLKAITSVENKKYTLEDIKLKQISTKYGADIFSAMLNVVNNDFVNTFTELISSQPWQTVKAFNVRIASNWDHREWGVLRPEAIFIQLSNSMIMSYLLNPLNVKEINERHGFEFTMIIQQIVADEIERAVTSMAKKIIHSELLEKCWVPAASYSGTNSTYSREWLIKKEIKDNFWVEYEKGKYNRLYGEFVDIVFENNYVKALNYSYR